MTFSTMHSMQYSSSRALLVVQRHTESLAQAYK